jgi:CRISPR-associated protein Csb2
VAKKVSQAKMLGLEIEFLTGVLVASRIEDKSRLDFPPQPDRVFSALVASWGARGETGAERAALQWLEQQQPVSILAGKWLSRSVPTVFVPPNDAKTSSGGAKVIPQYRPRQERRFPAARLVDPVIHIVWDAEPDDAMFDTLDAIARDTSYVGHSLSLTRCRFVRGEFDLLIGEPPVRTVYPGRLEELERAFHRGRRPDPGEIVTAPARPPEEAPGTPFSDQWIVFEDDGGRAPDLRAFPTVAKKLRDALMGAYQRAIGNVPEWLSGHTEAGVPSARPHLAIVPLADLGWDYSEGRLMGCAVVLPRGLQFDAIDAAIGELLETRAGGDAVNVELHVLPELAPWYLKPTVQLARRSLRPERWTRRARVWTTATPIALDRYPKKQGDEEIAEIHATIARSCENLGLPKPTFISIAKYASLNGAPPARVRSDVPTWQRWRLPGALAGRYLTHATIGFDVPVRGPLIVGAGRYVGLGLCLPAPEGRSQ